MGRVNIIPCLKAVMTPNKVLSMLKGKEVWRE
jgi:hypothetical protein